MEESTNPKPEAENNGGQEQGINPQDQPANPASLPLEEQASPADLSEADNDRFAPPQTQDIPSVASIQAQQYVDVEPVYKAAQNIKNELGKIVIGQEDLIELMLTALFIGGHCLLEGLPGIAKTLTSKLLAQTIDCDFSRIQFTPDLMPTDITGTSVFNQKESDFYFKKGPIFSNIILIDEVNRAPAKTQAALMEVMEESQLTYDGVTYEMQKPFFVIATQNPIEQEGTYALPEAQLDRFIFRIKLNYPSLSEEQQILRLFHSDFDKTQTAKVESVLSPSEIQKCLETIQKVHIKTELLDYIAAVINNTRNNGDLFLGASPRASIAMMQASKAIAAIRGRDFVTPDDIKHVSQPVLNHRVIISHEREMEGTTVEEIINNIMNTVEIPR